MARLRELSGPVAITMWDFSWLERRWPGAGYEDWGRALDELGERGYNAVRIDAYPHFVAAEPEKEWTILPCWDQQVWGSPAINQVRVMPALLEFMGKCRERGIWVGLSTWFQNDPEEVRKNIPTAEAHAEIWRKTLERIATAGLLETVLYVDLCNEWPLDCWAPFFNYEGNEKWHSERSQAWMRRAIESLRESFPDLDYTFSNTETFELPGSELGRMDYLDFLEPHLWMVQGNGGEFCRRCGYYYERFSSAGYANVQKHAERLYRADPEYWKKLLKESIEKAAQDSREARKPLITTECWGIVDYKDWPLLDWGWVKELCEYGTLSAVETGCWVGIATSNFCGPQFHGMWRDVEWHQRLTGRIKSGRVGAG